MSESLDVKVVGGQKTVAAAGTREPLLIGAPANTRVRAVIISALAANTGYVYVGDSTVSATVGLQLGIPATTVLQSVTIAVSDKEWANGESVNLSKIYLDVSVNGEGVSYLLMR